MSIRAKVVTAILLAVGLTITGISITVTFNMTRAFESNFDMVAEAQLNRLDAFITSYFDNALAQVRLLAATDAVRDNLDAMDSYVDAKKDIVPDEAAMPPRERHVVDSIARVLHEFNGYELGYVGDEHGRFAQAPNDDSTSTPPGFDPRKRPWYGDALKAGKAVITEVYLSDAGDQVVTTAATPIFKNGKQRGSVNNVSLAAPSMRGNTALAELGLNLRPLAASGLSLDLGAQGFAGKRKCVAGSVQMKLAF